MMTRNMIRSGTLLLALGLCHTAQAAISRNGSCSAAATSCTLSGTATGSLKVVFAFRSGSTTAPSLPSGWTNIANFATSTGGTVGSIRVGCNRSTGSGDTGTGTWTNATGVAAVSYSGTAVVNAASCALIAAPLHGCTTTTNCWAKTSTTVTYKGFTLGDTNTNSWIAGFMGGSASSTCTPSSLTLVSATGTVRVSDTNGAVSSFADDTCSVSSETWMSFTLEIRADCVNLNLGNGWTSIQCADNQVSSGTSVTATFPSSVTSGNEVAAMVLACGGSCSSGTGPDISSMSGSAITGASCETGTNFPLTVSFRKVYAIACPGVSGTTVTANFASTASFPTIHVVELNYSGGSGTPTSGFFTSNNGNASSGSGTSASTTVTVNSASDVFLCAIDLDASNPITPGSGFKKILEANSLIGTATEAKTGVSGSQNGTATFASTGWRIWCTDLAPSAGAGGGGAPPTQMMMGVGD